MSDKNSGEDSNGAKEGDGKGMGSSGSAYNIVGG